MSTTARAEASQTLGPGAVERQALPPTRPSRTYETSELGARRSFGHVLDDQDRWLVLVQDDDADHVDVAKAGGMAAYQRRLPRSKSAISLTRRDGGSCGLRAFSLARRCSNHFFESVGGPSDDGTRVCCEEIPSSAPCPS